MTRVFKRPFQALTSELVRDAQATVTGTVVDREGWRDDLPGWVVVNALAHRDWEGMEALARGDGSGPGGVRAAVMTFLAAETLAVAGSRAGLAQLQRTYLVPLELELLAEADHHARSPAEAVTAVRVQLARARARRHHPTSPAVDE
jgi:hypothetical protein